MRPWLLACVGILLVADGYWASQNLVLKSADDGIYWIPFDPMLNMSAEKDEAGKIIRYPPTQPELTWSSDRWTANGIPVTDITQFFKIWKSGQVGQASICIFYYQIGINAPATAAFKSIEAAFDAGVDSVVIFSPEPEMVGRDSDGVPVFNSIRTEPRYCNNYSRNIGTKP